MQNYFPATSGQHEVDACALEVAVEQQLRVGNDDRIGGNVAAVNRFGKKVSVRVLP
jgi:hypothetical protein